MPSGGAAHGPVAWLGEKPPDVAIAISGAKMGRLAELRAAGVAVPRGFVVTVEAYRRHCSSAGLDAIVETALAPGSGGSGDIADAETASAEIRAAFDRARMPAEVATAITDAYAQLCRHLAEHDAPVAVRSSATGEDSAEASFAGIFDTYLGMRGADRVLHAVRRCWSSLFTPRALAYRQQRGTSHRDMPIAVGVMELVRARAAGVAFSAHPVTGSRDRLVIEGSWGWGEAVVQGLVTPDHVEVGKTDRRVLRYDTAHKTVLSAFDSAAGQVTESEMPLHMRDQPVLDEERVAAIVEAVLQVEDHYGYPVDVEWAVGDDRQHNRQDEPVTILQARPITGIGHAAEEQRTPAWDPVAYAAKYAFGRRGGGRDRNSREDG